MRYKKCSVIILTIFICFIINYMVQFNLNSHEEVSKYQTPLDDISFKYLVRNEECVLGSNPFIVLLITSFSGNVEARDSIRRAYPVEELKKLNIIRVFLLAKLRKGQSKVNNEDIIKESNKYRDVLLGDFYESYRNLTYKHLMGLKWASEDCPSARYIAKMDDDIVVDLYKLIDIISVEENKYNITLMGYFFGGMAVSRDRSNKWYVSKNEYSEDYYPAFLSGWLYVTTPSTASLLVATSRHVPFFWIDDVYITGLLAKQVNIHHQNISIYFSQFTEFIHCCIRDRLACDYVAGPSNGYYAMHNSFKRYNDDCKRGFCKNLPRGKKIKDICKLNGQPVDNAKSILQQVQILI